MTDKRRKTPKNAEKRRKYEMDSWEGKGVARDVGLYGRYRGIVW